MVGGDPRQRPAQRGRHHEHHGGGEPEHARQPTAAEIRPLIVRATRMPISSPLITSRRPAALVLSRQRGAHRHDHLRRHRGEADDRDRRGEHGDAGRQRGDRQRAAVTTIVPLIRPRRSRRSPSGTRNARPSTYPIWVAVKSRPGGPVGDVKGAAEGVQQRLGVVHVRDRGPGSDRQQRDQAAADPAPGAAGRSLAASRTSTAMARNIAAGDGRPRRRRLNDLPPRGRHIRAGGIAGIPTD